MSVTSGMDYQLDLAEDCQEILSLLAQGPATRHDIALCCHHTDESVLFRLRHLIDAGDVVREGRLYRLVDDVSPIVPSLVWSALRSEPKPIEVLAATVNLSESFVRRALKGLEREGRAERVDIRPPRRCGRRMMDRGRMAKVGWRRV